MSSLFLLFVSLSLVLSHSLSLSISTVTGLKRCHCMLRIISCEEQNLGQSCRSRGWWSMPLCTCGTIITTFLPQGASASLYPHSVKWWSFLNRQAMQGKSSWCFYLFTYLLIYLQNIQLVDCIDNVAIGRWSCLSCCVMLWHRVSSNHGVRHLDILVRSGSSLRPTRLRKM